MTSIKTWMSSSLSQIPPLTTELAALKGLNNHCLDFFLVSIDSNLSKLSGKTSWMSENFGPPRTELAAFECLKCTAVYSNGVSTIS